MKVRKRILSGIQPTGSMHLGNYLGAVSNWVTLQDEYEAYFMVADLHALTSVYENPVNLKNDKYNLVLDLLAAGIKPESSCLFCQSDVPEHSELHVILSMITPLSWLTRVPSYKDKMQEVKDRNLQTYGFLGYPTLQAADILLYKANAVPVGKDQLAHLELTREIARRFNSLYGSLFPEPADMLTATPILPGTDGRKMSKSYGNTLPVSDSAEITTKLIMQMLTDPGRKRRHDPGHPEICPVFAYHKIFNQPARQHEIAAFCQTAQIGCVQCKQECADLANDLLKEFRAKRISLAQDQNYVAQVLADGAQRARQLATITINEVKKAINLV